MARYTGSLECLDGTRLYFVYQGTTDTCRPMLFRSQEEAFDNWDTDQREAYDRIDALLKDKAEVEKFEDVELVPYYTTGVCLDHVIPSTISLEHMLIVGHLSRDAYIYEEQIKDRNSMFAAWAKGDTDD